MQLTVDARTVYAYTGGREPVEGQPTVLMVHGAGADHTVWILQSRYLAHHGRNVLAVDLPGHGRSEGPALGSIGALADWSAGVLEAAGAARATLVGHSMGSLVVLEAAARHPARVAALVLVGTAAPMPVADALLDAARADDHAAFDMINLWGHSAGARVGRSPVPGMWMTGGALRLLERSGPGALHAGLAACNDYGSGVESARRVACPTLLVLGRRDRMTPPRTADELASALPHARRIVLDDSGHMLMSEKPDEVLDAILEVA